MEQIIKLEFHMLSEPFALLKPTCRLCLSFFCNLPKFVRKMFFLASALK